ncbi:MAG TPA: T9SS type A sorting domain-containing protein, partial [Rhodothermales bacterium]|nr:T9SS type A sorting domain-containing protein [Rhodothermales bacterium]
VDFDGTASYSPVVEVAVALERPLALDVRGTTLRVSVREAQAVRVEAFDVLGRRVAVLFAGAMGAGETQTLGLGSGLTPGVYIVRVAGERGVESRTFTLR